MKPRQMYALIDCNNFFASCERLFRPDLRNKPIVVLSSNDGCVIARSNEAKALGIAMGIPYFKIKAICTHYGVEVFSSNFTLYNDLSQRIMQVIANSWPQMEIYSIDEAFLELGQLNPNLHNAFCLDLQRTILRQVGIPTTIGIGPSKTLAKLANHIAKKELKIPVFNITHQREWLKRITVDEVWGVGKKWHKKLVNHGIYTVEDLANANTACLKKQFNVVVQRIHLELNGVSCSTFAEDEPQQSIISSRSFGSPQTEFTYLAQAISAHCTTAWEKLRRHQLCAQHLTVFIFSNRFKDEHYYHAIDFRLLNPTDDLRYMTASAKFCLKKIYQAGKAYKKAGIALGNLIPSACLQMDLFEQPSKTTQHKTEQFMRVFESINEKFGRRMVRLAAEGFEKPWLPRTNAKSPHYTTEWSEIPIVYM